MSKTLRIKELAQLLDCTRQTIHNMLNDGRLPAPIAGTKPRRWNTEEFELWLRTRDDDAGK